MATLFGKATPTLRKQLTELLSFIVAGMGSAHGYAQAPKNLVDQMEKFQPGLVTVQSEPDPAGLVKLIATEAGIAASGAKVTPAAAAATSAFALETGYVAPEPKRGGIKSETYPFAQMAVGQSFFVPATEADPNPAKKLASTVSSATKRFRATYPTTVGKDKSPHPKAGQPTGKSGAKFTVRARTTADQGEKANGARVYRIA